MKIYIKIFCLVALLFIISRNDCSASDPVFGQYEVGFESYRTYDDSRPYILNGDTISRPLLIHFWYPSEEKSDAHALHFKDYIDLIALREDFNRSKSEIDNHSFYYVKGYSDHAKSNYDLDTSMSAQKLLDSPVYAKHGISLQNTESEFPLLIYAPSNSKASVQNHMLCEYLASHGFMILSVASAGPYSIKREKFEESTIAQVTDMEYILKFCKDSLHIQYTSLGLFGFSSGGNAIALFQMRNEHVGAVLSMDGGQEYSTFFGLYNMPDFDLNKTNVPYLSLVNNYEDFSIYPYFNSIISKEKYLYRMPFLDHYGFVSYWNYFDSCSPESAKHSTIINFDYLSECALGFFSGYLKPEKSSPPGKAPWKRTNTYIQAIEQNYTSINSLCHMLLANDLSSAASYLENHKEELFGAANQVDLLARMFSDNDLAIWLRKKSVVYHPESWEAHFKLGRIYKEKGEKLLARKALLRAEELNPENPKITELLIDLNKME